MNMLTCTLTHRSDRLFACYRDKAFALGAAATARLSGYGLQSIVVGVRPEHLQVANVAGWENDGSTVLIDGRVVLVEGLGATNLVHVDLGDAGQPQVSSDLANRPRPVLGSADLLAILDGEFQTEPNWPIRFGVPESRVYLFNPETGAAV